MSNEEAECFGCGEVFELNDLRRLSSGDLYCEPCVEFYGMVDAVDVDDLTE